MTAALDALRNLEEQARRRREARDRRALEIREQVERQVRALLPPEGRAWLIGSLAWGGFGERSDVDLVVDAIDRGQRDRIERALAKAAGAEVDLLELGALPAEFRARVLTEGRAIHGG